MELGMETSGEQILLSMMKNFLDQFDEGPWIALGLQQVF